jgi:hypothetical protein
MVIPKFNTLTCLAEVIRLQLLSGGVLKVCYLIYTFFSPIRPASPSPLLQLLLISLPASCKIIPILI